MLSSVVFLVAALENLGFGSFKAEAQAALQQTKAFAAKKRKASTKLENLGIPEEELFRQQQELFAKVSWYCDGIWSFHGNCLF